MTHAGHHPAHSKTQIFARSCIPFLASSTHFWGESERERVVHPECEGSAVTTTAAAGDDGDASGARRAGDRRSLSTLLNSSGTLATAPSTSPAPPSTALASGPSEANASATARVCPSPAPAPALPLKGLNADEEVWINLMGVLGNGAVFTCRAVVAFAAGVREEAGAGVVGRGRPRRVRVW